MNDDQVYQINRRKDPDMAIGLEVRNNWYEIGSSDFFYSFFSTIAAVLEKEAWGKRFPVIMTRLYNGCIEKTEMLEAKQELLTIQKELKLHSPKEIVWNYEDRTLSTPWGDNISDSITDLSNYFYTSDGEELFVVFFKAIDDAIETGSSLEISPL